MLFKKFGEGFLAGFIAAVALILMVAVFFAPALFVVFLVLKLVGAVTFGWFYVFLPLLVSLLGLSLYTGIANIGS